MVSFQVVDAFTSEAFGGNPACVIEVTEEHAAALSSDELLQKIAREMNLSETVFVRKLQDKDNTFSIRWFTPKAEVDLCGHATLAAAHYIFTNSRVSGDAVAFESLSGPLSARTTPDGIELDFPEEIVESKALPDSLLTCLGVEQSQVAFAGTNRLDYLVELAVSPSQLIALKPDFNLMRTYTDARCVIITTRGGEGDNFNVASRVFAPRFGIDEDPVTGSAHCGIGPYWCAKLNVSTVQARQASERGGDLHVTWDKAKKRVLLRGRAVTVTKGEFVIKL